MPLVSQAGIGTAARQESHTIQCPDPPSEPMRYVAPRPSEKQRWASRRATIAATLRYTVDFAIDPFVAANISSIDRGVRARRMASRISALCLVLRADMAFLSKLLLQIVCICSNMRLLPMFCNNKRSEVMKKLIICAACVLGAPAFAEEHAGHEHGGAKLEVAVDGAAVRIGLDAPFDSLLGFEHAPKTDEQKAAVDSMLKKLRAGGAFRLTPAAKCSLSSVEFEDGGIPQDSADGHGDLEASFSFDCAAPEKLKSLEVGLFKAFPNLREIDAAVAAPSGQKAFELTPKKPSARW